MLARRVAQRRAETGGFLMQRSYLLLLLPPLLL
jgi:hypothetical protein